MVEITAITPPFEEEIKDFNQIDFDIIRIETETDKIFHYHIKSETWKRYCSSCERYIPLEEFGEMDEWRCDACCWDALETEAYGELE